MKDDSVQLSQCTECDCWCISKHIYTNMIVILGNKPNDWNDSLTGETCCNCVKPQYMDCKNTFIIDDGILIAWYEQER